MFIDRLRSSSVVRALFWEDYWITVSLIAVGSLISGSYWAIQHQLHSVVSFNSTLWFFGFSCPASFTISRLFDPLSGLLYALICLFYMSSSLWEKFEQDEWKIYTVCGFHWFNACTLVSLVGSFVLGLLKGCYAGFVALPFILAASCVLYWIAFWVCLFLLIVFDDLGNRTRG